MNRIQKWAWLTVAVVLSWLVLNIIVFLADRPRMFVFAAYSILIVIGIELISRVRVFHETKGQVKFDERDKLIQKNAHLAAATATMLFFMLVCYIPTFCYWPFPIIPVNPLMSTRWLGYMGGGAYLVYGFTGAVSILIQYSWKKKKNPEKARKAAIAVSFITIVLLIFIATVLVAWLNEKIALRIVPRAFYALTLIAIALSHIFLRKNRPSETGCHERSLTIKRKVVLASYITLIILFVTVGTHSNIISHLRRNTPLITPSMLPISLFLMLIIVAYSLTILIHYGWGDKNGK